MSPKATYLPATSLGATYIVGTKVSHTSYEHASELICSWAEQAQSRYVSVATVHQVMESYDSPEFREAVNESDLITPDGMPLVWGLKLLGKKDATRVYGPDLTPIVLKLAEDKGIKVGFYGGSQEALDRLLSYVSTNFPDVKVGYSYSPPFRALTPEEDAAVVDAINASGTRILFIGLNSPQQIYWMAAHKPFVHAVTIGVGAAFDFLSGSKPQAPRWMMRMGLEWFFRLMTEPKRMWKRYLKHNPRFVYHFGLQLLSHAHQQRTDKRLA